MTLVSFDFHENPLYFAYRRTFRSGKRFGVIHAHHGVEFMFIHQGNGTMILEQKTYNISPGMLCLFQPFQLHHIQVDVNESSPFIRSIVHFEPALFDAYFEKWPSLHRFFKSIHSKQFPYQCITGLGERPELNELFRSLDDMMPKLTKEEYFEEFSLFLVSFFRTIKPIWENHELKPLHDMTHEANHSEKVLEWISRHYAEPFDLKRMARDLHLTPSHLSHLFRVSTGRTISDYIAALRMRQAILLLTTSNRSVSEIGEAIGLTNSSYFCKFFKDRMGVTPYQYRKKKFGQ